MEHDMECDVRLTRDEMVAIVHLIENFLHHLEQTGREGDRILEVAYIEHPPLESAVRGLKAAAAADGQAEGRL